MTFTLTSISEVRSQASFHRKAWNRTTIRMLLSEQFEFRGVCCSGSLIPVHTSSSARILRHHAEAWFNAPRFLTPCNPFGIQRLLLTTNHSLSRDLNRCRGFVGRPHAAQHGGLPKRPFLRLLPPLPSTTRRYIWCLHCGVHPSNAI